MVISMYWLIFIGTIYFAKGLGKPALRSYEQYANCKKKNFVKDFVNSSKTMTDQDFKEVNLCSVFFPHCAQTNIDVFYSLADTEDEKKYLLVYVRNHNYMVNDCWGSVIQVKNEQNPYTIYFNFQNKTKDHVAKIPYKFNSKYKLMVQSLPNGPKLDFTTTTPSRCEWSMLSIITDQITKKHLFSNCEGYPELNSRLSIAKSVCDVNLDVKEKVKYIENNLFEKDCLLSLDLSKSSKYLRRMKTSLVYSRKNIPKLFKVKLNGSR